MPIRIGIVDEHEIVREGLKVFLETDEKFAFVGEATIPYEVLMLCKNFTPDVLIFDFLTGYDCHDLLRVLRQTYPKMHILILTTTLNTSDVVSAIGAGVHGYLFKQLDIDELATAIHTIHAGDRLFDREVEAIMASRSPRLQSYFFNFVGLITLGMSVLPFGHTYLSDRD